VMIHCQISTVIILKIDQRVHCTVLTLFWKWLRYHSFFDDKQSNDIDKWMKWNDNTHVKLSNLQIVILHLLLFSEKQSSIFVLFINHLLAASKRELHIQLTNFLNHSNWFDETYVSYIFIIYHFLLFELLCMYIFKIQKHTQLNNIIEWEYGLQLTLTLTKH
jgi:hypothetical protein